MKRSLKHGLFAAILALPLAACGVGAGGGSRDAIRAVGSSTVYPFAKVTAEIFSRSYPEYKSAIIESTGTGGGINLFCSGLGASTPDIANASRRMTPQEFASCQANGVEEFTEVAVGLDGLAFATVRGGIDLALTPEIVYRALAANPYGEEQTNRLWSDVDPSLPAKPILVYGPPSTSGTRDSLKELILEVGCEAGPMPEGLSDEEHDRICTEVRSDGAFVEQGEQDNLIVQKIQGNSDALGVFGYSYMEENTDKVEGKIMSGVEPTYENISSGSYPGARTMYIYVKNAHLDAVPGLREFVGTWAANWGAGEALARAGMVALAPERAQRSAVAATQFTPLTASDFE